MTTTFRPIDQFALAALLKAKRSQRVHAFAQASGWYLIVTGRAHTSIFARDGKREDLFPTLKDLSDYLSSIGVAHFLVDTSALDPQSNEPDVKARLREALEVRAYDDWVDQQVQEALDDPSPCIANSVVKERAAARRAELQTRLDNEKS
jgi:hypothetical protein